LARSHDFVNLMPDEAKFRYSAFGLSIGANRCIPGLIRSESSGPAPDVEIFLGTGPSDPDAQTHAGEPYYVSKDTDERGEPGFRIWPTGKGTFFEMDYVDGVRFWFDPKGTKVWCTWPDDLTMADAAVYLLGPVLGFLLRLLGVTCLHASAVAFGDRAVAFTGPAGAGKSTTAAALGRRGHAIISDDILAVRECAGEFLAFPAHPYLGLWPESVEILYGGQKTVPELAPTWDKRKLSLAENQLLFQERALPLGAICLLEERSNQATAAFLEERPTRDLLMHLLTNSFGTDLLKKEMRAREFEQMARLATQVPIWRLQASNDGSNVNHLCDLIEARYGTFRASAQDSTGAPNGCSV
jgi:hypothetical protein